MTDAMVVARGLTRDYWAHRAVDRIDFTVPRGEIVGFLGPNGAGKSTTLRMIAGFLEPTEGSVTVAGFDVVEQSIEARTRIGYMPEASRIYPEMRVEEYLRFRAEIKGIARGARKARIDESMEKARVTDVARKLIGSLSKGYGQRVGIADVLLADPPLFILDEPTAGLDPNQILETRSLIRSLGGEHTVILSTHILQEVEAVCTRVLILANGKIVAQGTPDEVRGQGDDHVREVELCVRAETSLLESVVTAMGEGAKLVIESEDPLEKEGVRRVVFRLPGNAGTDAALESLVRELVTRGAGVREVKVRERTLEQVFQEVTRKEPATETNEESA